MYKNLLSLLFLIYNTIAFSQITFEKGYFIDNGNNKIECLIKNMDWRKNPTKFEYQLFEDNEIKTKTIKYVKEFGIYDESKYKRYKLKVAESDTSLKNLSHSRDLIFKEGTHFLKTLIEGEANLHSLQLSKQQIFFFETNTVSIEQLIYKEYFIENLSVKKIGINNDFKKQLGKALECSSISMQKVLSLEYNAKSLTSFFEEYNSCNNKTFINYTKKRNNKNVFNLNIRPGLNSSSLSINNSVSDTRDTDFDNELSFRFGIEGEYILPFNKNKWALFIEPTYQSFKSEKQLTTSSAFVNQKIAVDYSSIELPLGVRYYFYIGDNSKIFINTGVICDFNLNSDSKIDFERSSDLELSSSPLNLLYGIGYKFNNKFSLEVRNQTSRELLGDFVSWKSDYKTFSIILGYTLF